MLAIIDKFEIFGSIIEGVHKGIDRAITLTRDIEFRIIIYDFGRTGDFLRRNFIRFVGNLTLGAIHFRGIHF